ncbi:uncharacterized protein PV06_01391 [Exophiala oligosperma]|uniref:Major facilitator superfamily (MFS) profile domain-containing protein n=1 Tax=Exophiala oligosperma TaxID=215243 RepID=A0A0D2ELQ8_9EURO|nr:uncharacterized protein PV06_01391 [Exophiala oligosperma]KIW48829.1 hypothetical protein PV06_01391 [Exophiala oligosperma]
MAPKIEKWSLGILNDKETEEVPGTVLLLSSTRNEPLGLEHQHARRSSSSMPAQPLTPPLRRPSHQTKKKTRDGQFILDPQPDDSLNDPLNWPAWRRDVALLSLGFYCMVGGGITPILAAGFNNVAETYDVSYSRVALTTGLYMMGLGVGSVIFSPTAILWGKRPVYLGSAVMFIVTSVWCAVAPSYAQLATARVFQGISVSPVECLPSATIAEIFFLHERAFRVGIYTLLLLGGKNLVPLVSAVIIGAKDWRWVFWVVTMVVGFCFCLLFFFVPETFWDRTPRPKSRRPTHQRSLSSILRHPLANAKPHEPQPNMADPAALREAIEKTMTPRQHMLHEQNVHARFEDVIDATKDDAESTKSTNDKSEAIDHARHTEETNQPISEGSTAYGSYDEKEEEQANKVVQANEPVKETSGRRRPKPTGLSMPPPPDLRGLPPQWNDGNNDDKTPTKGPRTSSGNPVIIEPEASPPAKGSPAPYLHNLNSPYYLELEKNNDYLRHHNIPTTQPAQAAGIEQQGAVPGTSPNPVSVPVTAFQSPTASEKSRTTEDYFPSPSPQIARYTTTLRHAPPKSYLQTLKPWNGRLSKSNWFLVACRPFILFAYPSVLWSALVYSLSVGWLIVLSESISSIYKNREAYNFTSLQAGLVYISPFVGGVLGTAVAGKVSDIIVRYMSRKNGGVYEPEFRLVMGIPIAITTAIGLMGFGWSAQERDNWIVPTIFFGLISFGCSLGSTTSITFCVDSYRQYAGEALVTLNFSKNIFHGLVFSLFFATWLEDDGPRTTFLAIGAIQVICLISTIPMYIYGKRARMWTVRKGFMEKF